MTLAYAILRETATEDNQSCFERSRQKISVTYTRKGNLYSEKIRDATAQIRPDRQKAGPPALLARIRLAKMEVPKKQFASNAHLLGKPLRYFMPFISMCRRTGRIVRFQIYSLLVQLVYKVADF